MTRTATETPPGSAVAGNNRRFAHQVDELKTIVDHTAFHPDNRFEDFIVGHGVLPYRMDLGAILHATEMQKIRAVGKLVFHSTGDTGNFKNDLQIDVSQALAADQAASGAKFLYHLGDVVYDYGEDREYPDQFYEIYQKYQAAVVGIPGNHDGSRFDGGPQSLVGFMNNFCDSHPRQPSCLKSFGVDFGRDTMTQPNCYWTLNTPFVTIIGVYTNVQSGGIVREPQISWFNNEMKAADPQKKLIVAMHHPVHSVASNPSHRGSARMLDLLQKGCDFSQRVPDLVLAGHVHNYQRFTTKLNGKKCVFVVAGCGGHAKDAIDLEVASGHDIEAPSDPGVMVNCATNDYVGYLRFTARAGSIKGEYVAVTAKGALKKPVDTFHV